MVYCRQFCDNINLKQRTVKERQEHLQLHEKKIISIQGKKIKRNKQRKKTRKKERRKERKKEREKEKKKESKKTKSNEYITDK